MIVKNEKHIIHDTLETIAKYIDYWVISDTGSTDGTQQYIIDFFDNINIKGELHHDEWKDFGHNRTLALKHAHNKSKYILVLDADDLIIGNLVLPNNNAYCYSILIKEPTVHYYRTQIFNGSLEWVYKGVLHEYPECISNTDVINDRLDGCYINSRRLGQHNIRLDGCYINSRRLGSRNADPNKYQNDANILIAEMGNISDTNLLSRYAFYCGQSLRDCNNFAESIKYYKKRIEYGNCIEELFVSYWMIGNMMQQLRYPTKDIIDMYIKGFKINRARSETLYELAILYKNSGSYEKAYKILAICAAIPYPVDQVLFIGSFIYEYGCTYQQYIISYILKRYDDFELHYNKLVNGTVPDEIMQHVRELMAYRKSSFFPP